jgi:8-oxo-dGTP diphosphatase
MLKQTAVKAVIYDRRGKILLQQRDDIPGLMERGLWGFFGGMVEPGESLVNALERELFEELGCSLGVVQEEVFRADRGTYGILNVAFMVLCTTPDDQLRLAEGQAFGWFALDELVELSLSSLVSKHVAHLLRKMAEFDRDVPLRLEGALLAHGRLIKKNDRVFYAKDSPAILTSQDTILLKELAVYKNLSVFRVCLHASDDENIHEMLMIHTCPQRVGPLKQNKTSLSYHLFDGAVEICLYDDVGNCVRRTSLDSDDNSLSRFARLNATIYRSIQTLSPYAIFLEVASGPFKDSDTIWLESKH